MTQQMELHTAKVADNAGGAGSRTTTLSIGAITSFLQCRRKFWFRYIEKLEPMQRARPLGMGSACHKGIELLLSGKPMAEVESAISDSYSEEDLATDPYAPFDRMTAIEILRAFVRAVDYKAWVVREVEQYFNISLGHGERIHSLRDGLIEFNRKLFILENKFVADNGPDYQHRLLWDDQAGYYLLAAKEEGLEEKYGMPVAGILYNLVRKPGIKPYKATPVEMRKYTQPKFAKHEACKGKGCVDCGRNNCNNPPDTPDGKMMTEAPRLYANMNERDERPDEFAVRVADWYRAQADNIASGVQSPDTSPFVQHFVYRTDAQLAEIKKRFTQLCSDLRKATREGAWYPNAQACSILPCAFASVCIEDTPEARAGNFVKAAEEKADDESARKELPF